MVEQQLDVSTHPENKQKDTSEASKSRKKDKAKDEKGAEKKNEPKTSKKRKKGDDGTPSVSAFFAGNATEVKPKAIKISK